MASPYIIQMKNVLKHYGNHVAVSDISLDIHQGEFLSILGPSGCGKTTTLRMIAGFEYPTEGSIILDGEDSSQVPPYERPVNTVFQNYALFPHMTIYNNIAFGLKRKKMAKELIHQEVKKILEIMGLEEHQDKYPNQLSGGQQQRVALARALVNKPKVLLLDEPLGALDLKLRKKMQFELKKLHKQVGITFIFVTHDQEEALVMSDRIVVMKEGNIEQVGTPEEVYQDPATSYVAEFIGDANILQTEQKANDTVQVLGYDFPIEDSGTKHYFVIRPEHIVISLDQADSYKHNDMLNATAIVKDITYAGAKQIIQVECFEQNLTIHRPSHASVKDVSVGQRAIIMWNKEHQKILT